MKSRKPLTLGLLPLTAVLFLSFSGGLIAKDPPPSERGEALDPGWPREQVRDGARLIVYQPQVDDWKNFRELTWRMAVSIIPAGGDPVVGVLEMKGNTTIDNENKVVVITDPQVTGTHFPPDSVEKVGPLLRTFLPPSITISLHRLIASVTKDESVAGVQLKNDPPRIFVAYQPSVLLGVDGEPVLSEIPKTNLKFVVNTEWPLFFDGSTYYLAAGEHWMSASSLDGNWSPTKKLPKDMSNLPQDKEWAGLKKIIPPSAKPGEAAPAVFYSDKPAEIILFDGQPVYAKIPDTQLTYATNTNSVFFVNTPTQEFYYLVAGRWFRAKDLQRPWSYATPDLPADFAQSRRVARPQPFFRRFRERTKRRTQYS